MANGTFCQKQAKDEAVSERMMNECKAGIGRSIPTTERQKTDCFHWPVGVYVDDRISNGAL